MSLCVCEQEESEFSPSQGTGFYAAHTALNSLKLKSQISNKICILMFLLKQPASEINGIKNSSEKYTLPCSLQHYWVSVCG